MASESSAAASRDGSSIAAALRLPSELPCNLCRRPAECKRCGGCSGVWYCGRDCQRSDWQRHRPQCHRLQDIRRWAAFAEHLGTQFSKADDMAYAKAPRDLSSLPTLPHLVLGTVGSSTSGQAYLNTCRFSHERPGTIPMFIMSEDLRSVESNPRILDASFRNLFGGKSLEAAAKAGLPIAVKRSFLHEPGFQLPSIIHAGKANSPFGSEQCVFVLPSPAAASAADKNK
ncbi:hypothetical protein BOX15_Mlig019256g1 [Macrostomum lignano]|uniref:MYND-type domain-containing protein n=1 Tax=Macrostomum lignano TaxID=282301 RepID=A0A267E1S8_9PLAT|nr:hypothetical protein BOX15_Mlig019256g1 [Macrostomum lignano]